MTPDEAKFSKLLGIDLPPERLREVMVAFAEIRAELNKLHELDLGDTHPAVVFQPVEAASGDD
jgi:hypothetical protein